jgi:hypothetical protein
VFTAEGIMLTVMPLEFLTRKWKHVPFISLGIYEQRTEIIKKLFPSK